LILRQKDQYLPESVNKIGCIYPVRVLGNSMEPAIKDGIVLSMNKCIKNRNNLPIGTIVVFEENGIKRVARIKEKLGLAEGIFYKMGRDNRQGEEFTASSENIIAIGK
jgi:phage repressor protein C with HTH and peptisase S24 domain